MRMRALVMAVSLSSLLTACGGSSGGGSGSNPPTTDPTVRTGHFTGLNVEGLHYQTATQSGLTSANGEFNYIAGEQIHFSLGGIELGSTTAQAEINLITELAGTLPSTRDQILTELAALNDVTAFDEVINIATLLMALDADRNVGTGIDLADLHSRMAGVTLDFDVPMSRFLDNLAFRQVVAQYGKRIDLPYKDVILALYQALDRKIAAPRINRIIETHASGQVETSYLNYGPSSSRSACQYTREGQLCSIDVDTDGVASTIETAKLFTRDSDGALIREEVFLGASTQTAPIYLFSDIYTPDSSKRLGEWRHEENGVPQFRVVPSYSSFNLIEGEQYYNLNSNHPDTVEYELISIFSPTTLHETLRTEHFGNDTYRQRFERDAVSTPTPKRTLIDADNDGSFDDEIYTYYYDTPESLDHRIDIDFDGDEVVDLEQAFSHDAQGRLAAYHGQLGENEERITDTFNTLGQLDLSSRDVDGNGTPEWVIDYGYNAQHLINAVTQIRYSNGVESERISVSIDYAIDPLPLTDGLAQILDPEYEFEVTPLIETCILNGSELEICHGS
jgi:hypothetical protein